MTADRLVVRLVRTAIVAAAIALVCRHFIIEPVATPDGIAIVDRVTPVIRAWKPGEPVCATLDSGRGRVGHFVAVDTGQPLGVLQGDLARAVPGETLISTESAGDAIEFVRFEKPEGLQSRLWCPVPMDARVSASDDLAWEDLGEKWQFASLGEAGPPLRVVVPPPGEAPDQRLSFSIRVLSGAGAIVIADDRPPRVEARVSFGAPAPIQLRVGEAELTEELGAEFVSAAYRAPRRSRLDLRRIDGRVELHVDGERVASGPAPRPLTRVELQALRDAEAREAKARGETPKLEPIPSPTMRVSIDDGAGFLSEIAVDIDPEFSGLSRPSEDGLPRTLAEIGAQRRRPPVVIACHDGASSSDAASLEESQPDLTARIFEASKLRGRALLEVRTDPWSLRWIR